MVAVIAGAGRGLPPPIRQDEIWSGYFAAHYQGPARALAQRIFANAGVVTRHAAVSPLLEDVSQWPTARRMERYLVEAMPLAKEAAGAALADAGLPAGELGLLAVCSCTGYATPGLDILLARDLGLAADCRRLFVGHMGCYAALPGLSAVADAVTVHQRPALLLCTELASLHVQAPTVETGQIVAHALFSDAAAAVVVTPGSGGYEVVRVASLTDPATADHMTWDVTDLGFRMGLSPRVPEVLASHVGGFVTELLAGAGIGLDQVDGWAVHPGGPHILDVVERELALPGEALADSRGVLADHGNCSSPTVLLILERLRKLGRRTVVAMAFGPGLTLYAAVLHHRPPTHPLTPPIMS
ncbi:type III polyketide synthase [Natronosporangium hydrolyticum]|uniref:Type III polyketide synthase n=1 Tax=Natronosporangium hydrolyticum TaxID=2811111 RepID=A0A895YI83_9ACTN|nr:type III polyketide synthase [Natronosporangium hydrolyticum]QSB15063.1 type III polyketide synthase [Natronosporangium hydrolyticum]